MTLTSETSPVVSPVVRPYFFTCWPTDAASVLEFGVPYPSSDGVALLRFAVDDSAIAASIVLSLPSNRIGSKSNSSPILSAGSVPPSKVPGCNVLSPMEALLVAARTWLLLRAR